MSTDSAFDAWVRGDESAISESAKRGFVLFTGKAQCNNCHMGWNFKDYNFYDIGLGDNADIGRETVTGYADDRYRFKTPSLQSIAHRSLHMHNGSLPSLEAVIGHYIGLTSARQLESTRLPRGLILSSGEIQELIDFLHTLTGDDMLVSLPVLPN